MTTRFGKYDLIEKIGAGGMAEIYKSRYAGIDGFEKILVVKKILPTFADNTAFIKMLINEAKLSSNLIHANIVQIYELGEIDDQYYIAMEFVDGQDLLKVMSHASKLKLRIPLHIIFYLLSEVSKGLNFAHAACDNEGNNLNIIHRDVSPSNVIISHRGEVKIMDFGVARANMDKADSTRAGTLKGKLGYMSPEQVTGKQIDNRSDIFSLGIVFFELLTLKRMFLGKTDLDTMLNIRDADLEKKFRKYTFISEGVKPILRKILNKNREKRFQTAQEVQEAIGDFIFENQLKVSNIDMANYLRALFADNPREELAKHFPSETWDPKADVEDMGMGSIGGRTDPKTDITKVVFRLRDKDGNIVGPFGYTDIVGLINEGSVSPDELVSYDQQTWIPLASVPQLATFFDERVEEAVQAARYEGDLSPVTLPKLIYRLAINGIQGKLRLVDDKRQKDVFLANGQPVHVTSNIKSELLGEFLVARGTISDEALKKALKKSAEFQGRLGDTLISMGMIQPHQLFEVLSDQFRDRVLDIFTWTTGEYRFFTVQEMPEVPFPMQVTWYEILTEACRSRIPFPLLEQNFQKMWGARIGLNDNPYTKLEELKLHAKETRIYNLLRQNSTIKELTQVDNVLESIGLERIYRTLFLLLQTEFIQFSR